MLPLTLGVLTVLSLLLGTVVAYTAQNARSATDSTQRNLAYASAERGLNDALAVLYQATNLHSRTALPASGTVDLGNGLTYSYTSTFVDPVWTITATGTAANRSQGGRPDSVTLKRSLEIVAGAPTGVDTTVWNYLYSDAPPGNCLNLSNNSAVGTPLYVRGDLCLSNNAHVDQNPTFSSSFPNTPQLQVGGQITLGHNAYIGSASAPLNAVETGVGCGSPPHNPCSASDSVWAGQYIAATPNLTKPVIDLATWYKDSAPGPLHGCTSGTMPGGFDNNGLLDGSLGTVNLTPLSAYDCKFVDALGNTLGELAWTPGGGGPGTLMVAGTIFFDGNLVWSTRAVYQGRGTIYFSGSVSFTNNATLCGIANCTAAWDTANNLLVLVAGSNAQSPSYAFDMSNNGIFQGAAEANGDVNEANNVGVWGSLIGHQLFISNNALSHYVPFGTPVPGQPAQGAYAESLVLKVFSG